MTFQIGNSFVYHRVPSNLVGGTLYPLNALALVHLEEAEFHQKKYQGREQITEARIPPLDCLWNDVLMLSPVHPGLLIQALRDGGRIIPPQHWYAVDATLLEPERTSLFVGPLEQTLTFSSEDYLEFTPENLQAHFTPVKQTLERLRSQALEPRVFMFTDIPHVFTRGHLRLPTCSSWKFKLHQVKKADCFCPHRTE